MFLNNLGVVERKVLGALLLLADENCIAKATKKEIADRMGYSQPGGTITYALRILQRDNYIVNPTARQYQILI